MSDSENLNVGKRIFTPSHVFGSDYLEIKEYEVIAKDDERAILKHKSTAIIPGGQITPADGEEITITCDKFPYYRKSLNDKFNDLKEIIDLVITQTNRL